jgi:hypothetical protein
VAHKILFENQMQDGWRAGDVVQKYHVPITKFISSNQNFKLARSSNLKSFGVTFYHLFFHLLSLAYFQIWGVSDGKKPVTALQFERTKNTIGREKVTDRKKDGKD